MSGSSNIPLAPGAKKLVPLQERLTKKIEDLRCDDAAEQGRLQQVLTRITKHCFKYVDKAAVSKSLSSMRSGQKQHAPLHSCNQPCKQALVQYNVSRCIDPALRKFAATNSHSKREAFRSTVDVAFKSCFGDACLNIHAQHAALKVVQELVGRCRVEIRNWLGGKPTAQCSTACKSVLSMYQADPCIANGLQELGISDFEKQYFWEMYAHAYDACLSTDDDAPPKSFCEKDRDSAAVAEVQINDVMRQCGKANTVNVCSQECRVAYSKFRTAKCSNVVLVQMSFALQTAFWDVYNRTRATCAHDSEAIAQECQAEDATTKAQLVIAQIPLQCEDASKQYDVQHPTATVCTNECKGAMEAYEATPCVNKALNVKYGRKTVAHDVYSRLYQRAYRFCFQTACWSVDGVNRAVDVVSKITHHCQAEVKLFMEKSSGENVACTAQCTEALNAFDTDKCASHTIRHLPKSAEEKKFFWNVYAWAYDVCVLKDKAVETSQDSRDVCAISSSEQLLSRSAAVDLMKQCKQLEDAHCSKACFEAFNAFQNSRCRLWALNELNSVQRQLAFDYLRRAKTNCRSKTLTLTEHDRKVVDERAANHRIGPPPVEGIPMEEHELNRLVHPPPLAPPSISAPGPLIVPHTEVSFSCASPNGLQQAEVVIETVQLSCESEAAAFADETAATCRPPCQSALRRYGEQQQCVLHFAMQMETGQASFYETAAWSLSICSKNHNTAVDGGSCTAPDIKRAATLVYTVMAACVDVTADDVSKRFVVCATACHQVLKAAGKMACFKHALDINPIHPHQASRINDLLRNNLKYCAGT
jgi:hypothetical protein